MPNKPFSVISGSGWGWGRYATLAEAIIRKNEVAQSHANVEISWELP